MRSLYIPSCFLVVGLAAATMATASLMPSATSRNIGFIRPTPPSSSTFTPILLSRRPSSPSPRQTHTHTHTHIRPNMRLNNNRYSDEVPLPDRALSAAPYLLAVMDGITYSKFLAFYAPGFFNPLYALLDPLLAVYKASPFVNLAVYLLIVWVGRQPSLSRYVRFNFQQAIILDIALVIPSILTSILREQAAPVWVQEPIANTLFFVLSASILYVCVKLALGEKPNEIPIISEAAEMTSGPF